MKLNIYLPYGPEFPLLHLYLREMKTNVTKHLYENVESNFIYNSQMGNGTNVPQYVDGSSSWSICMQLNTLEQ